MNYRTFVCFAVVGVSIIASIASKPDCRAGWIYSIFLSMALLVARLNGKLLD